MSSARERAMGFLMENAAGVSRSCALVVGLGEPPTEALATLCDNESASEQATDWQAILGSLDDIGALGSPLAERACGELSIQQREDGSWCGVEPGVEKSEIYSTGMIADFLAKTHFVRQRTLDAAADHLATGWDPDRVKGDAWESTAAYFHCFSLIQHEASDAILQWCGRELQRGLVTGVYDAVRTTRVFVWCRAHALPGAPMGKEELLERLVGEQCDDGGFRCRDGDAMPARVAHTFDALVGLVNLG